MKNVHDILTLFLPMLLVLGLTSCSQTDGPVPMPAPVGELRLSLELDLDQGEGESRAPAGDYNPGVGYENYIGIQQGDFAVYLLDETTNTVLSEVLEPMLTVAASTAPYKKYRLVFAVGSAMYERLNGKSVKLLMLANWGNYPAVRVGQTLDEIVKHSAAEKGFVPFGSGVSETQRIPMFGIKRYDNITLVEDETFDLGTLHLLRAYAKTEIIDGSDPKVEKFRIAKVELLRYNDTAAKAPYDVDEESDYVKNNWDGDYVDHISVPESARVVDALTRFGEVGTTETDKSFVIYCPEFANAGKTQDESARIKVTFSDGQEYYVEYQNYLTSEAFDIRRNYYYRYTVSRKYQSITLEVDVYPYIPVDLRPSFGIDPSVPQP